MNRIASGMFAAMLSACVVAATAPAWGQPASAPPPRPMAPEQLDFAIEIGAAVREQRLDEAAATLSAWENADAAAGRPLSYQRAYWQGSIALARAERAEGAPRGALLMAAEQAFESAWALRPGHSGVALQRAMLSRLRGDLKAAERWHEAAASAQGLRPQVEALNAARFAEFLRDQKRGAEALRWSQRAVALQPDGASTQALHLELLTAHAGVPALAGWLDERRRAGATVFAARSALGALPQVAHAAPRERWSLLLVAVAAMANDTALTNARPGVPQVLQEGFIEAAKSTDEIGKAAAALRAQLEEPRPDTEALAAWRSSQADPVTRLTPRAALRQLSTTRARDRNDAGRSERWWRLAVELGDRGPDPDAFVSLVAHLSEHGRAQTELPALMQRYEEPLFSLKGSAYNEANWALVFRMHMALGMAYGASKRWTSNDSPFRNAVFQLDAAMRAAERANQETDPRRKPAEPLAVPAEGLALLAEGLRARGNNAQALDAQLSGAERLKTLERHSDVATVVRDVAGRGASDAQRLRLERLEANR